MEEKMARDILVYSPVSFGDTVTTPFPLECHVLFEWPLSGFHIGKLTRIIIFLYNFVEQLLAELFHFV